MATSHSPSGLYGKTHYKVLSAVSLAHFLNDSTQSLLVPLYPMLKGGFDLSFTQVGLITLTYQLTASLLQPLVGLYTDRHPQPYSLPTGMMFSLSGLLMLAFAPSYSWILAGAALLGTGSSIFHPESSRVARMAAGGRFGLAQSVFQVGGNAGSSMGPLLATVVVPLGQWSVALFSILPLAAIAVLLRVSAWAGGQLRAGAGKNLPVPESPVPRPVIVRTLIVLLVLIFSKHFYTASISSYFIFYLQERFAMSLPAAQVYLFLFLFSVAAGTMIGGPVGDRIGRKYVIWGSILGVAPFTLLLPHAGVVATGFLVVVIGLILASAFSAMVVLAQEMMPGHVGTVAGLFFGLSFGMGGLGAAVLGRVADVYGIEFVYQVCAYLPLLGILAVFLPNLQSRR